MPSIDTRLLRLVEEAERRRLMEEEPIDPLSQSMFEYDKWWDSLTEKERQNYIDGLESN